MFWNGLYKIEMLDDNALVLCRIAKNSDSENPNVEGGAFLWNEFVKK